MASWLDYINGLTGQNPTAFPAFGGAPAWLSSSFQTWPNFQNLGTEGQNAWSQYMQQFLFPYMQMAQNQNQWAAETAQQGDQWNRQFDWTQQTDQAAMDLANRQQNWTESWQPQQQANQIGWERESQANQLAYNREALDKQLAAQAESDALSAWGRRVRPNARYL